MVERGGAYDVVVIGGGLSGMLAAAAARGQGARVALVAEGAGTLELSSGCIDLLGAGAGGRTGDDPWAALARLASAFPDHPYALLGRGTVCAALAAFQAVCARGGLFYEAAPDRSNQFVVTALGALRPTYLVPGGMAAPRTGEPLWIAGFPALRDFHPGVVAAGLGRCLPGTPITWGWVDLPPVPGGQGDQLHPVTLARCMDDPAFRTALVRQVAAARPAGPPPRLILLPAVLGLHAAAAVRAELAIALEAAVAEVPLPPPSVPGLRLADVWRHHLQQEHAELLLGARAVGARLDGNRAAAVTVSLPGGTAEFRADAFVLATGGIVGNGLVPRGRTVTEPIAGLPVEIPASGDSGAWAGRTLLPAAGHGFSRIGVRTDATLRPAGLENLYVCGRMLAGQDPYAQGCGGGVAVASGWRAGLLAGGAAL